jgi:hypothetical protein
MDGIGSSALLRVSTFKDQRSGQLAKNPHYTQVRSSDDERLSNLVNCETFRPVVACDGQTMQPVIRSYAAIIGANFV